MKKIMKKMLSLMLVLAMMLVPMTAMAAGESEFDPIVLDGTKTSHEVTVDAGATVYYSYQAPGYYGRNTYNITVSNSTRAYDYYLVTAHPMSGMVNYQNSPNMLAVASASTMSGMSGAVVFAIQNTGASAINFTVVTEIDVPKPGSSDLPDTELTLGQSTTVECLEKNWGMYFYYWTVTEAGTFTVAIDNTCLDTCDWTVGIQYVDKTDGSTAWVSKTNTKSDNNEPSVSADVEVGDKVSFFVGNAPAGEITFTASVTSGSQGGDQGGNEGGDQDGNQGGDTTEQNYYEDSTPLVVGDNKCTLNSQYTYTVYNFAPTETGKFTISSNDSVMGIVGYNWVNGNPTTDVVKENSIEWECTAVGQGIYVAVFGETNEANINIKKSGEADIQDSTNWIEYKNKATLKDFTFTGNVDKLQYVNTEDKVVDKAVLGKDGYYHLNKEDGPILFVDLNDELMDMNYMANEMGQVRAHIYDKDGKLVESVDYNAATKQYINVADEKTMLYPLTEDLMTIYKNVGADPNKNWYGENGYVGGTEEDAWMFACYYQEGLTSLGSTTATGSVKTGDNANVALWMVVMMVGVATMATTVVMKKRER